MLAAAEVPQLLTRLVEQAPTMEYLEAVAARFSRSSTIAPTWGNSLGD